MKRLALAAIVILLGVSSAAMPAHADRFRGGGGFAVGFGLGALCCGYYPYYSPSYYGYPAYYAPPTVVYQTPPVTYVAPPAYYTQAPAYAPPPAPAAVAASQASPVFADDKGRTCRTFQTTVSGSVVNGTACLQPDGTWRTVGE